MLNNSSSRTYCLNISYIDNFNKKTWRSTDSFRKISILNNDGHICWKAGQSDKVLKENYPRTLLAKFGNNCIEISDEGVQRRYSIFSYSSHI